MSLSDNIPEKMKAIAIAKPGEPEQLQMEQRPVPVPGEGDVLIKVHTAGVNRPDCLQRAGLYDPPPGASDLPGLEVSGEIIAIGTKVDEAMLGRKVMALTPGGGYAQYVVCAANNTLSIPGVLSMEEAGAIPETFFTVWHNVFERGGLKQGETFLVHGGTSGIGTTAIQLARAFGAKVMASAGSDEKCEACLQLGANLAINYREDDFVAAAKKFGQTQNGRKGVDLILDMVGGDYIDRNFDAAAIDGRIVQIAFLGGAVAKANFAKLMVKRLTLTGSTLRPRSVAFKHNIARQLEEKVWPLIEAGKVKPVMYEGFALEDASKAHELMEAGEHIGKIILRP